MRLTVILVECLLSVLMVTIVYRNFFALRNRTRFLALPYILCALTVFGVLLTENLWIEALIIPAVLIVYIAALFDGAPEKMIGFGVLAAVIYTILFGFSYWYLQINLKGYMSEHLMILSSLLLSELLMYTGTFIVKMNREERKVPITYYFPCIPLLLTLSYIHFFAPAEAMPNPWLLGTLVSYILMILFAFDFACLAIQSYLIALLHNRNAIRLEHIRQEILESRYQILKEQYQNSFNFLHSLLRSCAELSIDMDEHDMERIRKEVNRIASLSFSEFNDVCISTPILNELLEKKKTEIEQENILVSTVLRSDHFGLLTFDEQRDLFDQLLDFSIDCIRRSSNPVRTLVIKSLEDHRDILLYFRFPADFNPESLPSFQEIRKNLSGKYAAGIQVNWDNSTKICTLLLIMPVSAAKFSWNADIKQSEHRFLP